MDRRRDKLAATAAGFVRRGARGAGPDGDWTPWLGPARVVAELLLAADEAVLRRRWDDAAELGRVLARADAQMEARYRLSARLADIGAEVALAQLSLAARYRRDADAERRRGPAAEEEPAAASQPAAAAAAAALPGLRAAAVDVLRARELRLAVAAFLPPELRAAGHARFLRARAALDEVFGAGPAAARAVLRTFDGAAGTAALRLGKLPALRYLAAAVAVRLHLARERARAADLRRVRPDAPPPDADVPAEGLLDEARDALRELCAGLGETPARKRSRRRERGAADLAEPLAHVHAAPPPFQHVHLLTLVLRLRGDDAAAAAVARAAADAAVGADDARAAVLAAEPELRVAADSLETRARRALAAVRADPANERALEELRMGADAGAVAENAWLDVLANRVDHVPDDDVAWDDLAAALRAAIAARAAAGLAATRKFGREFWARRRYWRACWLHPRQMARADARVAAARRAVVEVLATAAGGRRIGETTH
jgi:hypothetical protein